MSSTPSKMLKLRSSENEIFELDETAALQSESLKHMIEDGCADSIIPVPNVTSKILEKVIEYLHKHAETPKKVNEKDPKVNEEDEALKAFDAEFVDVEQDILFPIIMAANYLSIKTLLKLGCQTVADMARGKTVEEIRKHFNIRNDLTPEEEEQIHFENAWSFDTETPKDEETQDANDEETQDAGDEEH